MSDPTNGPGPTRHSAGPAPDDKPDRQAPTRSMLLLILTAVAFVGVGCTDLLTPRFCSTSPTNCSRVAFHRYLEPLLDGGKTTEADIPLRLDAASVERTAPIPSTRSSKPDLPFYGMQYVPTDDLDTVAALGVNAVLQDFPHDDPEVWIEMLDAAQARDMKVVAWQWPSGWEWDDNAETWTITPSGRRFIETVADHPALLAVYGVHEPYWNECFGCGWTTAQLRDLYRKIKRVRNVPVYAAFDGFDFWRDYGSETTFGPGVCDICDTWYYPVLDDEYDRDEYINRLATELSLFRELAPNSQFVWVVQAFGSDRSGRSLPNAYQLREMVDLALWADIDGLWWYTWDFDSSQYEEVLSDHRHLHPVVRDAYDDFVDLLCPSGEPARGGTECGR